MVHVISACASLSLSQPGLHAVELYIFEDDSEEADAPQQRASPPLFSNERDAPRLAHFYEGSGFRV